MLDSDGYRHRTRIIDMWSSPLGPVSSPTAARRSPTPARVSSLYLNRTLGDARSRTSRRPAQGGSALSAVSLCRDRRRCYGSLAEKVPIGRTLRQLITTFLSVAR